MEWLSLKMSYIVIHSHIILDTKTRRFLVDKGDRDVRATRGSDSVKNGFIESFGDDLGGCQN